MRWLWGSIVMAIGLVPAPSAHAQDPQEQARPSPAEPSSEPAPVYSPSPKGSWNMPLGYTAAALGVAGLGTAIGLTVMANRWDNKAEALREQIRQSSPIQVSDAYCSRPLLLADSCAELQEASDKGDDFGLGASLAAHIGVPIAAVGVLLVLTAPDLGSGVGVLPVAGPNYAGISVGGSL